MKDAETANQIDEAAFAWSAKLDREGSSVALEAELEAWLAEDARHRGAFLRAQALWQRLDRASQANVLGVQETRSFISRRGVMAGGGVLAAAAAVAGFVLFMAGESTLETAVGEVRRVTLPDGSTMVLNTEGRAGIAMDGEIRRIKLANGEAWFQVKKNPRRPFVVEAGNVRVRAVGTAFSVRRMSDHADVSVTEGVVEAWVVGRERFKLHIAAGQNAVISETRVAKAVPVGEAEIARRLAWRSGEIDLNGQTLAEAVAEFNRYNLHKLIVTDAALGQKRVYGVFRSNDPEGFAKAVAVALDAAAHSDGESIAIGL